MEALPHSTLTHYVFVLFLYISHSSLLGFRQQHVRGLAMLLVQETLPGRFSPARCPLPLQVCDNHDVRLHQYLKISIHFLSIFCCLTDFPAPLFQVALQFLKELCLVVPKLWLATSSPPISECVHLYCHRGDWGYHELLSSQSRKLMDGRMLKSDVLVPPCYLCKDYNVAACLFVCRIIWNSHTKIYLNDLLLWYQSKNEFALILSCKYAACFYVA